MYKKRLEYILVTEDFEYTNIKTWYAISLSQIYSQKIQKTKPQNNTSPCTRNKYAPTLFEKYPVTKPSFKQ